MGVHLQMNGYNGHDTRSYTNQRRLFLVVRVQLLWSMLMITVDTSDLAQIAFAMKNCVKNLLTIWFLALSKTDFMI